MLCGGNQEMVWQNDSSGLGGREGCVYIEGHGLTQEAMWETQGGRGHCEKWTPDGKSDGQDTE